MSGAAEWGAVQHLLEATAPPAPVSGARIWHGCGDKRQPRAPHGVSRWNDVPISMS